MTQPLLVSVSDCRCGDLWSETGVYFVRRLNECQDDGVRGLIEDKTHVNAKYSKLTS